MTISSTHCNNVDNTELYAWLRLTTASGVGVASVRKLLVAFATPEAVFTGSLQQWAKLIGQDKAQRLQQHQPQALFTDTCQWLAASTQHHVIVLGDADYPQALLQTPDPPNLLYAAGQTSLLNKPGIAIVGSRTPTEQGKRIAADFAGALAQLGQVIISGLALGIDAQAHRGALAKKGGTIAVLGTGIDLVYPTQNRQLAAELVKHGLLLSEFPLGVKAQAYNFPKRNRLIAGLTDGCLVVEATERSGSLITARLAGELGKEVFAIPGSIYSPMSRGCHRLLREGATLVERIQDMQLELNNSYSTKQTADDDVADQDQVATNGAENEEEPINRQILQSLAAGPLSFDALLLATKLDHEQLAYRLSLLEIEQKIACLPDGLYQGLVAF